jgi:hypothetical protein
MPYTDPKNLLCISTQFTGEQKSLPTNLSMINARKQTVFASFAVVGLYKILSAEQAEKLRGYIE